MWRQNNSGNRQWAPFHSFSQPTMNRYDTCPLLLSQPYPASLRSTNIGEYLNYTKQRCSMNYGPPYHNRQRSIHNSPMRVRGPQPTSQKPQIQAKKALAYQPANSARKRLARKRKRINQKLKKAGKKSDYLSDNPATLGADTIPPQSVDKRFKSTPHTMNDVKCEVRDKTSDKKFDSLGQRFVKRQLPVNCNVNPTTTRDTVESDMLDMMSDVDEQFVSANTFSCEQFSHSDTSGSFSADTNLAVRLAEFSDGGHASEFGVLSQYNGHPELGGNTKADASKDSAASVNSLLVKFKSRNSSIGQSIGSARGGKRRKSKSHKKGLKNNFYNHTSFQAAAVLQGRAVNENGLQQVSASGNFEPNRPWQRSASRYYSILRQYQGSEQFESNRSMQPSDSRLTEYGRDGLFSISENFAFRRYSSFSARSERERYWNASFEYGPTWRSIPQNLVNDYPSQFTSYVNSQNYEPRQFNDTRNWVSQTHPSWNYGDFSNLGRNSCRQYPASAGFAPNRSQIKSLLGDLSQTANSYIRPLTRGAGNKKNADYTTLRPKRWRNWRGNYACPSKAVEVHQALVRDQKLSLSRGVQGGGSAKVEVHTVKKTEELKNRVKVSGSQLLTPGGGRCVCNDVECLISDDSSGQQCIDAPAVSDDESHGSSGNPEQTATATNAVRLQSVLDDTAAVLEDDNKSVEGDSSVELCDNTATTFNDFITLDDDDLFEELDCSMGLCDNTAIALDEEVILIESDHNLVCEDSSSTVKDVEKLIESDHNLRCEDSWIVSDHCNIVSGITTNDNDTIAVATGAIHSAHTSSEPIIHNLTTDSDKDACEVCELDTLLQHTIHSKSLIVAIVHDDDIYLKLTDFEAAQIQRGIIVAIDRGVCPARFVTSNLQGGLYRIECADLAARVWLEDIISRLVVDSQPNVRYRTVDFEAVDLLLGWAVVRDGPYTGEEILQRLMAQNTLPFLENWRVERLDAKREWQVARFGVDRRSLGGLVKADRRLYFGMRRITVHIISSVNSVKSRSRADNGNR